MLEDHHPHDVAEGGVPKIALPFIWGAALVLVHVAIPFGLSLLGVRHGWGETGPSYMNMLGLVPVAAGLAALAWCLVMHFEQVESRARIDMTPNCLLLRGPYAFTRNPMYLSVVVLWLGWAAFFGSVAILVLTLLIAAVLQFSVIPYEERSLDQRFGDDYRRYCANVPRWIPK